MKPYDVFRLLLSSAGGLSWNQLNFPSYFAEFDAYPDTPELTLLKEIKFEEPKDGIYGKYPYIRYLEIVSSGEDSIQLFIISGRGGFLRATIKSPN